MARVNGRLCNICGERITMKEEEWILHGEANHPGYFLQGFDTKCLKPRFGEKNFFNPETGNWHTDRKYLARELATIGWTNERFYLTHGEKHLPEVWDANNNDPQTGNFAHMPTCGCCGGPTKFNQWDYDKFCSFSCSTKWYADNSNRIERAMATLRDRKAVNPDHHLRTNQLRYWTNRGLSDEEARGKVSVRNAVNKKENYIERAGGDVEAGTAAWAARQRKWLATMKRVRAYKATSKVSKTLFDEVCKQVPSVLYDWNEHQIQVGTRTFKVDCYHPESNKIIEFYGDYWHMNPETYKHNNFNKNKKMTAEQIWAHDSERQDLILSEGYHMMVVWENDFANDPTGTLQRCIDYLTVDNSITIKDDDPLIIW